VSAAKKPPGPPAAEADALAKYRAKRSAGATPEPIGSVPVKAPRQCVFVVHEHKATRHHWDLRIEIDGVLVSWAVPKEPSMDPDDKRLAVKVESHPLEYLYFEAVIPPGNYGAGPMIVWDRGLFVPLLDAGQGMRDGEIKFELYGYKLRGAFTLVHTGKNRRGRGSGRGSDDWLLIKKRDAWAETYLAKGQPLADTSVLSGLTIDELFHGSERAAALTADIAALGLPRATIDAASWKPMLCEPGDDAFTEPGWIFELKYDGFRLGAFGGAGPSTLRYRSGHGATDRFPEIASAIRSLPVGGLALDGEVVVLDGDGKPTFQLLQQRTQLAKASDIQRASAALPATYFVFDLLGLGGFDLRGLPLVQRKELLRRLLPPVGPVRYADHVEEQGAALYAQILARGLEGVVAKKADSTYRGLRSRDWLKIKHDQVADFAVCGWTPPEGSRSGLGALHLCIKEGDSWRYAGKVGSGLDERELGTLTKALRAQPAWAPPFEKPEGSARSTWVEPSLVVEVRYREWTDGHRVRLPVFLRLRPDKHAEECVVPANGARAADADEPEAAPDVVSDPAARELRLSNLKKIFWPHEKYTKGDLINYYRAIAPWMLPYLVDRPTVITRFPDGIEGKSFYQKDLPDWVPPWLRNVALWSEGSEREIHYVLVDDADGLAYLANLGSIPIHVWASRTADLGRPDWTIIDLDPKGAPREWVVPLALAVRELTESIGLPTYVKTSGQTGLHILVPLGGQLTYDQARQLAYLLGMVVEQRHPDKATTLRNPQNRNGRVYLDWGQNAHGQLLVAPYSVRPVAGAPVSMPLTWDEVTPALDPKAFNIKTALARVERFGFATDPVRAVLTERPDLGAALEKLTGLVAT
jgi:bifunctional non-homologous end joining protein LigD